MINSFVTRLRTLSATCLFLLSFVVALFPQATPKRTLLISSCASEAPCGEVTLHRFQFQAGKLISQEVLYKIPAGKTTFQAQNQIFENRYIVSPSGAVFDLETKNLHDERVGKSITTFVGRDGNLLFVHQLTPPHAVSSFYSFDLLTKKYKTYNTPTFYSLFGTLSPDGKRAFSFDNLAGGFFVIAKKGNSPSDFSYFLTAGKFKISCGKKKCRDPDVPAIWIDNDRFLTQRSNGDLVVFDYPSRKWSDFVKLSLPSEFPLKPGFFSDKAGGIYYDADKLYRIDVDKKQYSETNEFGLGHGFVVSGRRQVKTFLLGDQKLSSFISGNYHATDGYLAAEFQEEPLTGEFPVGVRVYGKDLDTWTRLRIKFRPHIIGWLTE